MGDLFTDPIGWSGTIVRMEPKAFDILVQGQPKEIPHE